MQPHVLARGLAVSAVSALAITGLASAAHADTATPTLISQFTHKASTRFDGDDQGVTLTAQVAAGATAWFEYQDGSGAWTQVEPAGSELTADPSGYVRDTWTPDAALIGQTVPIRVAETAASGDTPTYSAPSDVKLSDGSPTNSVHLSSLSQGYFPEPYASAGRTAILAAVSGTTSALDGNVELSWWRASDGTFQGQTKAAVSPTAFKVSDNGSLPGDPVPGGSFTGALDITAFDAADGDVLPIAAQRDSDDVEPVTLYEQHVGSLTFTAFGDPTPQGTPTVLTVADAETSSPIAGAQVRRTSDDALVGYTDGAGQITVLQQPGSTGDYYVNTGDDATFDAGDVEISAPTPATPDYTPVATSTVARLADGDAFDTDEYAPGDIALQVVDQAGTPYASASKVSYSLYRTGTTPTPPVTVTADPTTGRVVIPFDPSTPGSYTLAYSTPDDAPADKQFTTTFTVGDSVLSLAPGTAVAPSGGTITYTGTLSVDGLAMPGRRIDLHYARGTELAPGGAANAGIGTGHGLAATTTTDAHGEFTVTVQDPAEAGSPTETGGRLTASTGDNVASGDSTLTGNARESDSAAADFGTGRGTVVLQLTGLGHGARADRLKVTAPVAVAGKRVVLYRKLGGHQWTRVGTRRLSAAGHATFRVADHNGKGKTRYKVALPGGLKVKRSVSDVLKLS